MSTKAYITKTSLFYRVIVFSHIQEEPLDVSPFVVRVNGSKSLVDSQSDNFIFELKVPDIALLFQNGDWVQIDLETPTERAEHLFFGQILGISGQESVASDGGGISEIVMVTAVSWGSVFERYVRDLETYMRVNADTLFPWRDKPLETDPEQTVSGKPKLAGLKEPNFETPPSLATIAQGKLRAHPWQAVAMTFHHLCRYGGTFGQQFWLPRSYTGLTELVPLIEYVGRINKMRLPNDQEMGSVWGGLDSDANNVIVQIEKRDVEDGNFKTNVPEDDRGWKYSDWHNTFAANQSFVPGLGYLRDFVTVDLQTTLADLALDLSDPAFNELFYSLQERCTLGPQNPSEAVIPVSGQKVPFDRSFIMTIALRPIPHPTWASEKDTIAVVSANEQFMITADGSNYDKTCSKFVLGLGHTSGAQFSQSISNVFSYFNVVPQDQELQTFEKFDAAEMLQFTSGRIPVIDEELMQTFGHQPMIPKTRYYIGGEQHFVSVSLGPSPFIEVTDTLELPSPLGPGTVSFRVDKYPMWEVLASKALALYSWHARGWEHYDGSFSMPIIDTNVPRPGDVGYLFAHRVDSDRVVGSHFRNANRKFFDPKILADQLSKGAVSVYVDSVSYDMVMSPATSLIQGTVTVNFSHGVWCDTVSPNAGVLPYKRFVNYSEVGISPIYFLPPALGSVELKEEISNAFAQITVVKATDLVSEIEGEKDSSRKKKRRKRGRRRRKKRGLRKTTTTKGNATKGGISFSLVSINDFEAPDQTKKTKRNPSKKATGEKWVLVEQEIEVKDSPGIGKVLLSGAFFGIGGAIVTGTSALGGGTKKVPMILPVKTNKMGVVEPKAREKAFSIFDEKNKKGPSLGGD